MGSGAAVEAGFRWFRPENHQSLFMKLRIIKHNDLFVPQEHSRPYGAYYDSWHGIGSPAIRFAKIEDAQSFLDLISRAVRRNTSNKLQVVWKNPETLAYEEVQIEKSAQKVLAKRRTKK